MNIKGRLKAIADCVNHCDTVCDIGTDHGYIPIYLIKNGICRFCIATDLREGPLKRALFNIKNENLGDKIELRTGYGLFPIGKNEADTVIIAGMGGMLINEILERGKDISRNAKKIILQPMNSCEKTREWLYENGYSIENEVLIKEGNKLYNILETIWDGIKREEDSVYYHIGKMLIKKKDPLLGEYIKRNIRMLDKKINGLKLSRIKNGLEETENLRKKMVDMLWMSI
jgi:tRNA (adenine22-N1)-methyltransferase